ncbi:MAG: hypothetical protein AB7V62_14445 [Thermoleophilia bacterium]
MLDLYRETILETGRSGIFFMLIAFVVTFAITRGVTRHIRAKNEAREAGGAPPHDGRSLIGDITIGGVHIHHQVWGILLILVSAGLEFAYQPDSPWLEILGAMFGAGAALTLDEFALWLYLDDVYWTDEGRKSIDAVLIAGGIGAAMLLGTTPFGVDEGETGGLAQATGVVLVHVSLSLLSVLKGKIAFGLIGLFLPPLNLIGALRLAKPTSPWARWFYRRRPRKMARAQKRYGEARTERLDRWRDRLGGKADGGPPSAPPPAGPAA